MRGIQRYQEFCNVVTVLAKVLVNEKDLVTEKRRIEWAGLHATNIVRVSEKIQISVPRRRQDVDGNVGVFML